MHTTENLQAALAHLPGNIVVLRAGQVVLTRGDITRPYPTFSIGKSLAALVVGRLLLERKVSLEDMVPGTDATLRQFLTMTSDYGLTPHEPGRHFAYNTQAVHVYMAVLSECCYPGLTPMEVADAAFWGLVGHVDRRDFRGQWGGHGGGFRISARDLARLGLCVLAGGVWRGEQLIDPAFIEALYVSQISPEATAAVGGPSGNNEPVMTAQMAGNYSFGWWTNANGQYPAIPCRLTAALGKNGNKIIVWPEAEMVIAVTAREETYPDYAAYVSSVQNALR